MRHFGADCDITVKLVSQQLQLTETLLTFEPRRAVKLQL